jgi:hypothetical protein
MGRLWFPTFLLALLLLAAWGWDLTNPLPLLRSGVDLWLLVGGAVALAFSFFALVTRSMAYVQARPDHLRLVTPFFRMKVSYRRVRSVHPASFQQLFPAGKGGWAAHSFLSPFYRKTAVVVELTGFPAKRGFLRLFLPSQMFLPKATGFVLLVPDWMELATEMDSLQGIWRQRHR